MMRRNSPGKKCTTGDTILQLVHLEQETLLAFKNGGGIPFAASAASWFGKPSADLKIRQGVDMVSDALRTDAKPASLTNWMTARLSTVSSVSRLSCSSTRETAGCGSPAAGQPCGLADTLELYGRNILTIDAGGSPPPVKVSPPTKSDQSPITAMNTQPSSP
jgi:hypothetical protein